MNAITRREDPRFLTGQGRYADNTAPREAAAVSGQPGIELSHQVCGALLVGERARLFRRGDGV